MMTADVMTSVKIVVMTLLIQPSNQDCVLGNIKVHKNKGPKPKKIMRETSLISSIPRAEKVKYTLSIPRATVTMHMARISGASVIQLNFPISPETASNALVKVPKVDQSTPCACYLDGAVKTVRDSFYQTALKVFKSLDYVAGKVAGV